MLQFQWFSFSDKKETITLGGIFAEDEHFMCLSFTYGTPFVLSGCDGQTDTQTEKHVAFVTVSP